MILMSILRTIIKVIMIINYNDDMSSNYDYDFKIENNDNYNSYNRSSNIMVMNQFLLHIEQPAFHSALRRHVSIIYHFCSKLVYFICLKSM